MKKFTVFGENFSDILDQTAEEYPNAEAVVYGKDRITYSRLKEKVDTLAKGLIKLGMKAGDHIALWMPNNPEWIYAMFAIAKAGGVIVPVNSRYKAFEIEYIIKHSDAKALFVMDHFLDIDYLEILRSVCPELSRSKPGNLECDLFPYLKDIIVLGKGKHEECLHFDQVMEMGDEMGDSVFPHTGNSSGHENPAVMFYTSGTTGLPKGCLLSYGAIYFLCNCAADLMEMNDKDIVLATSPYFHMFGMHTHIITSVLK